MQTDMEAKMTLAKAAMMAPADKPCCVGIGEQSLALDWEFFINTRPQALMQGVYGEDQRKVEAELARLAATASRQGYIGGCL